MSCYNLCVHYKTDDLNYCYILIGCLPSSPLHLSLYQFDITPFGLDQLVMTPLFLDSPILDDVDHVGLTNGAESVGNGDCCPALRGICESFVHLKLRRRVESRSRLYERKVLLAVFRIGNRN